MIRLVHEQHKTVRVKPNRGTHKIDLVVSEEEQFVRLAITVEKILVITTLLSSQLQLFEQDGIKQGLTTTSE